MAKSLIVYYSRTGNTKFVAECIRENTGSDIEAIIDKKNRSGVWGFIKAGYDTVMKKATTIKDLKVNLDDYETIFIGSPVWANGLPPALKVFFDKYKIKGKSVNIFVTTISSGGDIVINQIKKLMPENDFSKQIILDKSKLSNKGFVRQDLELWVK